MQVVTAQWTNPVSLPVFLFLHLQISMSPGHLAHLCMPWHLESNKAPHAQVTEAAPSTKLCTPKYTSWYLLEHNFSRKWLAFHVTSCNIFCCGLGPLSLIPLSQIFPVLLSWYINTVPPLLPAQQLPGSSNSPTISWEESRSLSLSAICEILKSESETWVSKVLYSAGPYLMTCKVVFRRWSSWGAVMELPKAVSRGCCPVPSKVGEEGRNRPK